RIVRRPLSASTPVLNPEAPEFADAPIAMPPSTQAPAGNIATAPARAGRRLDMVRTPSTASSAGVRVVPGQLPTFERSYLIREMRQIFLTAGSLLALIIVLTFILR